MSNLGSGKPDVQGEVTDFSSFTASGLKGIPIIFGITERGEVGVGRLVKTTGDYTKYFGGVIAGTEFPYMALRGLSRGGAAVIVPQGHYTDVADKDTLVGTKATATLTGAGSDDAGAEVELEASSAGPWANASLVITTTVAKSGNAGKVDVLIALAGYPSNNIALKDVKQVMTDAELAVFNSQIKLYCKVLSITDHIPIGSQAFAAGARTVGAIVVADYIGNAAAKTGIYAADNHRDVVRIAVPEIADGDLDNAIAAYVDARKDLMGYIRTPMDLDADTIIEYREGEGAYDHTAIDSWRMAMYTGGIVSVDSDGLEHEHSELIDILVNKSRTETQKSANWSTAGLKRGIVEGAKRVVRDFGASSMSTDYSNIYNRGVNAVIMDYDPDKGTVVKIDGNRTLWKTPQLTQKLNVAEYLVWLFRMIYPIVKKEGQYDPNDPEMWNGLYQKIKPILKDSKEKMRAIYDWAYVGDQFATSIAELEFNDPTDVSNGIYKFRPLVQPTPAAEWIGFEIGVTNAGVSFADFTSPTL